MIKFFNEHVGIRNFIFLVLAIMFIIFMAQIKDIAILFSGDTDYVNVLRALHDMGKIVVIARFPHQNTDKYRDVCDKDIILKRYMLDNCIKGKGKEKSKQNFEDM